MVVTPHVSVLSFCMAACLHGQLRSGYSLRISVRCTMLALAVAEGWRASRSRVVITVMAQPLREVMFACVATAIALYWAADTHQADTGKSDCGSHTGLQLRCASSRHMHESL